MKDLLRIGREQVAGAGFGVKEKEKALEMDVKRYAKYLLEEDTIEEERALLEQLRGKIVLKDKCITLAIT